MTKDNHLLGKHVCVNELRIWKWQL
jgi:hypothetical protein